MRSRLMGIALMMGSLLVATASGQRSTRQFALQDDQSGSHFTFDSSGNYVYAPCGNGIKIEGVGNVRISGCTVTLESVGRYRLVQAEADLCKSTGKASILLEGPCLVGQECVAEHLTVTDSSTANNSPDCEAPAGR
jgi:hypothetical protein